jgi:hypothetical protein
VANTSAHLEGAHCHWSPNNLAERAIFKSLDDSNRINVEVCLQILSLISLLKLGRRALLHQKVLTK